MGWEIFVGGNEKQPPQKVLLKNNAGILPDGSIFIADKGWPSNFTICPAYTSEISAGNSNTRLHIYGDGPYRGQQRFYITEDKGQTRVACGWYEIDGHKIEIIQSRGAHPIGKKERK